MASSASKPLPASSDEQAGDSSGIAERPTRLLPLHRLLFLLSVFLLQFVFFSYVALHRFIDGDEGFYLLASRLVLEHKKPYIDFLFEQAPLFPYFYALWMKCFGVTWTSARLFAALLTTLTGTLVCDEVWRQTRRWLLGVCATIMFANSMLIFGFFPVAKTFSLAGLLVFAAYVVVSRLSSKSASWVAAAGGLLLGLSMDVRSYLAVVVPFFVWWILRNIDADERLRILAWFMGGGVLGLIPVAYFFLSAPDLFLFNNLGYHELRSSGGLVGMWEEKLVTLFQLFLIGPESNGIQTAILILVSVGFLSLMPKRRYAPRFAFQIAVAIGLVSLLPTPAWPQYFCLCIPFLLVSTVCVTNDVVIGLESRRARIMSLFACALVALIYVVAAVPDFHRYLVTGEGVPGVRAARQLEDLKLEQVREVSRAIDEIAAPGEIIASVWSGYVFQTRANPLPGLEGDYALSISEKLTSEQRTKYHVVTPKEIEAGFASHRPRIVVLRDYAPRKGGADWQRLVEIEDSLNNSLRENGYGVARSIGGVSIYVYNGG